MQIQNLKLINFRNFDNFEIDFSSKKNILVGKNGIGKTNIIESIYYLCLTKSFRSLEDNNLLKFNKTFFKIKGSVKSKTKVSNYEVDYNKITKKAFINKNNITKLSDYISNINVICFTPDDLKIIKDTPSFRRKYFNIIISEYDNKYLKILSIYNRLIKQRNAYLKQLNINSNSSFDYLNIITDKIIKYGLLINKYRNDYINSINDFITNYYYKITKINDVKLYYDSGYNDKNYDEIKKIYQKNLNKDIILGKTLFGIHHDDYKFIINLNDIKNYFSEGQLKNVIISLKLSELEVFNKEKCEYPILLLDDVFSELDKTKINNILKNIKSKVQVIITTTDLEKINKNFLDQSKIIKINTQRMEN